MLDFPKSSTTTLNQAFGLTPIPEKVLPLVNRGQLSLAAERQHLSLIVYAVPSERIQALLPSSFEVEEAIINGKAMGWVSVESFLDLPGAGQSSFEQTNYRLHALRDGKPCRWLMGASLGSLLAVGVRNLWPMPWHLSAMEFHVAYDPAEGCYQSYSLQTQSQWANASWQIEDTGEWISSEEIQQLPASLRNQAVTNYFLRRDGSEGQQKEHNSDLLFTRGQLTSANCDFLERLGLLNRDEIKRPQFVALQHNLSCQFGAPSAVGATLNQKFLHPA
jgi:hypothetical protein